MKILIQNRQKRPLRTGDLKRAGWAALRAEGCPQNSEVSLLLCGDRRIRTLNRLWRNKDAPTDVLAFPQLEDRGALRQGCAQAGAPALPLSLGDVVISVPTAARQARENGLSLQAELRFLLVHGILHLLGWEDDTARKRAAMLARQKEILETS